MTASTVKANVKVAIGVPSSEFARYAVFYDSLFHLNMNGLNHILIPARGANISENRNGIVERALKSSCSHIFFVDDDQVLHPNTVHQLLSHDRDIVSGVYLKREPPFIPHIYDKEDESNGYVFSRLFKPFERGLVGPLVAVAAGCLLVSTNVFKALDEPYWTLGQLNKVGWSDDVDFCKRARAKGFKIWADLDCLVGHMISGTIWPMYNADGSWTTVLMQNNTMLGIFPAAQPTSNLVQV